MDNWNAMNILPRPYERVRVQLRVKGKVHKTIGYFRLPDYKWCCSKSGGHKPFKSEVIGWQYL